MDVATVRAISYEPRMISAKQIRAARALVSWTQEELARVAGLSNAVINNVETERVDPRQSTLMKIQAALEGAGIEFLSDRQNSPDGGPGVRLRRA